MKIKATVIETADRGDYLAVVLQGENVGTPEHLGNWRQELRVNITTRSRRAFFIGREVEITVRVR